MPSTFSTISICMRVCFAEGFQSWMWRGLTFLLPFLFFGHVSQTPDHHAAPQYGFSSEVVYIYSTFLLLSTQDIDVSGLISFLNSDELKHNCINWSSRDEVGLVWVCASVFHTDWDESGVGRRSTESKRLLQNLLLL